MASPGFRRPTRRVRQGVERCFLDCLCYAYSKHVLSLRQLGKPYSQRFVHRRVFTRARWEADPSLPIAADPLPLGFHRPVCL
jgi:hypothetical protein